MKAYAYHFFHVFIWDKKSITRSGDNLNGHDIVHKNYSYHVASILFVDIYHISCSDEFVNDS